MNTNTCKKMFAAILAAATMITSIGVSFAEETSINYIEQTALDSDYNKTNITSSFTKCAQTEYTAPNGTAEENPTYSEISEENVIKFDWQPTQVQTENWHWFRIFLGTKEQLVLNEKNNTVTYNNYSDSENTYTRSFSYNFANDTETVYNIYINKTDGDLTFGIKKSSEETYTGIKIADAVNDGYNCIRMRTFGFKVKISNAYVYTKKVPMPEIAQEVLDSDYDVFDAKDYLFNNGDGYSINNKKTTTYNGLEDEFVIKFRMKPGLQDGNWQNLQIILGSSEKIVINQMNDTISYKNSKTNVSQTINYDFVNDGTAYDVGGTSYDIYISKLNSKLTFGIKQIDVDTYTWFETENAVNDDCTYLQVGTNGFRANLSYTYVYTKKVPMPEVAQSVLDNDYGVFDAKDYLFNNGDGYSINNKKTTTYNGLEDEFVIKFRMKPGLQDGNWQNLQIILGSSEKIVINQMNDTISYKNSKTNVSQTINYDFVNDGTAYDVGGTSYDIYISKLNSKLTFGIKQIDVDTYTWFETENAVNDDCTYLQVGTNGFRANLSYANVYTKKKSFNVGDMPMLTEKEISDKFDTKLKKGTFTFSDSYFEPYCSGFSDYVISFDFFNKSGSPYTGDFMVYLNAPNTSQSGGHEYEKITFDPQKTANDICYANDGGAKKMRFGYEIANESSEIYNVYISKIGSEFIFGIKKNGETEYSWFKTDSTPNTGASNLVFRTTNRGVTVQNLNIYTAKPIVSYVDYTKTADGVKANVNAVRYTDSVKENVTAVTMVYKVFADGSLQMTDIVQSKPTTLERYVNTSFENHVSLPETAENEQYKVVSYLWDAEGGIVPIGMPIISE